MNVHRSHAHFLSLAASIDVVSRIRPSFAFVAVDGPGGLRCRGGMYPFRPMVLMSFGAASSGCRLQCPSCPALTQMRDLCVFKPRTIQPVLECGPRGQGKSWQPLLGAVQLQSAASMPAILWGGLWSDSVWAMHGQSCHCKPEVRLGYHQRQRLVWAARENE